MSKTIEIYEWIDPQARAGTERTYRDKLIDRLAIPSDHIVPQVNDVLIVHDHSPGAAPLTGFTRYRVMERELAWTRTPEPSSSSPQTWTRMWLHVRRLDD